MRDPTCNVVGAKALIVRPITPMEMASMKWFSTLTSAACVLVGPTLANLCHAENVQSGPPSYIEADRMQAEKMLGRALAGDIFSDRFTALRKRLIAVRCAPTQPRDVESRRLSPCRPWLQARPPRRDRRGRSDTSSDVNRMCAGRFCCSFQQR